MKITLSHIAVPDPSLMMCDAGGEAVILSPETGRYYGLNEVGLRLWRALEQHGTLAHAHRAVLSEYDVDSEQLEADLLAFVQDLAARKLLKLLPPA
jgi:hypothetical protein